VDALAGFRLLHFGENLTFNPSSLNFTGSRTWWIRWWADEFRWHFHRKVVINILGDVGGWGTGLAARIPVAGLARLQNQPL